MGRCKVVARRHNETATRRQTGTDRKCQVSSRLEPSPEAKDLTDGWVPRIKVWMAGSEACSKQIGPKLDVVAGT